MFDLLLAVGTTQGVVASADLDSATLSTDPVNVIYARAVGINPRPFYVAAGRINYNADLQTTCNFTFSADVQVAPPGTLIANITSGEPAFAPYQNITLTEGNKTVNAAPITTQSVVFYIPEIPAGTVYLAVNITVDSSITGLNAYGASYAITSNPRNDECYSGDGAIYTSRSISIYEIICFSPRAFEPYYVNVDAGFGVVTQINASFAAVVCPTGLYGPSCDEPVFAFDLNGPSTQLFNGTTAANGVVHFYFDWPANTWNTTLFIARERNISLTNNILTFREGSYTSVNQKVLGIYPYSTSGFFCTLQFRVSLIAPCIVTMPAFCRQFLTPHSCFDLFQGTRTSKTLRIAPRPLPTRLPRLLTSVTSHTLHAGSGPTSALATLSATMTWRSTRAPQVWISPRQSLCPKRQRARRHSPAHPSTPVPLSLPVLLLPPMPLKLPLALPAVRMFWRPCQRWFWLFSPLPSSECPGKCPSKCPTKILHVLG